MSRAIPLFGAHEHTFACDVGCPNLQPPPLTRKQRRWIRRAAVKAERRERRRDARAARGAR